MPRYTLLLFTVLALFLAACGGDSTTPTPPPDTNPPTTPPTPPAPPEPEIPALTLSGTANGYTGAAGELVATMQNSQAEVATGTIAADGSFSLELPGELTDEQVSDSNDPENYVFCEANPVDVSSATWEADLLDLPEVRGGGEATGELLLSNAANFTDPSALTGLKQVTPVYSTSALSVTGDCSDDGVTTTFDMQLQTGWNYIVLEVTNDDASTGTLSTVPSLPTDARWDFVPPSSPFSASGVQGLPQWTLKRR